MGTRGGSKKKMQWRAQRSVHSQYRDLLCNRSERSELPRTYTSLGGCACLEVVLIDLILRAHLVRLRPGPLNTPAMPA